VSSNLARKWRRRPCSISWYYWDLIFKTVTWSQYVLHSVACHLQRCKREGQWQGRDWRVDDGTQESCVVDMFTYVCINADDNKNEASLEVSKKPQYPLNRRLGGVGGPHSRAGLLEGEKISCTCRNGCTIRRSCWYAAQYNTQYITVLNLQSRCSHIVSVTLSPKHYSLLQQVLNFCGLCIFI
jgi:hypothetical protein